MASGNRRRAQELAEDRAQKNRIFQANMTPSAGETALTNDALSVLNYRGDYAGLPGLVLPTFYNRLKSEQAQQNRGAATFGRQYADPNLLAGLNATEEANASQMDALAFQDAVAARQAQARAEAAQTAALQGGRLGTITGPTFSQAMESQRASNQPGFWQRLLFQAMNNASNAAAAAAGRP